MDEAGTDSLSVATSTEPDAPCDLRRRSSANFEQSGEAGAVNHVWDASFQDYISNVRPSALIMFVPSGAVPADAPGIFARTSALAAGEAHYVLRVLGFPVVALSNTNPMSLSHGLVEVRFIARRASHASSNILAPTLSAQYIKMHAPAPRLHPLPTPRPPPHSASF